MIEARLNTIAPRVASDAGGGGGMAGLDDNWPTLKAAAAAVETALTKIDRRPFLLGICGAQGSGKSTLAEALAARFSRAGRKVAVLSIDDLYKTKAAREQLARDVHPLLRTRGVPGTHDVALGLDAFNALDAGAPARLPRFDKGHDDRAAEWATADADTDLLILEGWFVGAVPEELDMLSEPVNPLEQDEDAGGAWRAHVNRSLAEEYQRLFGRIDFLILLAAPGFDIVRKWRIEQEHALRDRVGADAPGVMSDAQVGRFIQHYERLTRHILAEMPARADFVVALGEDRSPIAITSR